MSDKQLKSLGKELSAVLGKLLNVNGVIYTAVGSEDCDIIFRVSLRMSMCNVCEYG